MRGFAVVAALIAVAIGSCPAEARVKAGPGVNPGWHKLGAASSSALDLFTAPTAAYSSRKLKSTYSGSAVRLRRASDNAEQDIGFVGFVPGLGSPFDFAAANAFCAATSCFVRTWYDQSGNARDATNATAANQPALLFNCRGALPCMQSGVGPQALFGPVVTPATGVASLSVVGSRDTGTLACAFAREGASASNRIQAANAVANLWVLGGSAGSVNAAAADGAWHSAQGVVNGASSALGIDGVATAGTVTGATAAAALVVAGGAAAGTGMCSLGEAVLWDNYVLTAAEQVALTNNQRSFWGF